MGGYGNDRPFGGEGNDVVICEAGNEVLGGGPGNDIPDGGAGNDTYLFNLGDGGIESMNLLFQASTIAWCR